MNMATCYVDISNTFGAYLLNMKVKIDDIKVEFELSP